MKEFLYPLLGAFIGIEIGEILWTLIFEPLVIKLLKKTRSFIKM